MCGIFSILNGTFAENSPYWDNFGRPISEDIHNIPTSFSADRLSYGELHSLFMNGRGRGPEMSKLLQMGMRVIMGFHRLAINGLTPESDQPISIGDIHLVCNGEIYNYKELYKLAGATPTTQSDCEVIIHLYKKYGIEYTLGVLDGVFAFVLLDQSMAVDTPMLYIARDPYGVCPLYINQYTEKAPIIVSSELKMMYCEKTNRSICAKHFPTGSFSEFYLTTGVSPTWKIRRNEVAYFVPSITLTQYPLLPTAFFQKDAILKRLRNALIRAVEKRCECTERPIACLLSGGLDSSLIASIVSNKWNQGSLLNPHLIRNSREEPPKQQIDTQTEHDSEKHSESHLKEGSLHTYSIGLAGSEDLRYAKIVADHIGSIHTEIVLTEAEFLEAIPEVIYAIESYDTTTIRASIGNYLVGKYIARHSEAKVIFNGDGADELMGGYLYMQACPDALEYDRETRRLLQEIHAFDVLRSNKCIASNGLEPRTPYLDREFTQTYLSIPPEIRFSSPRSGSDNRYVEKRLIRESFMYSTDDPETQRADGRPFLPDEILWRRKEAFSDGVSKHSRSLFEIIQEYTDKMDFAQIRNKWRNAPNPPRTKEQIYYRSIFENHFPEAQILPRFWMPKYVLANDASARTLTIYDNHLSNDSPKRKHVSFEKV